MPTDAERNWWAKALTDANFARDALRPIVDAAFAYSDGTGDNSETPEEDALLDAVNDYRRALLGAATTDQACPDCGYGGPHNPLRVRPDRTECGGTCGASWTLPGADPRVTEALDFWQTQTVKAEKALRDLGAATTPTTQRRKHEPGHNCLIDGQGVPPPRNRPVGDRATCRCGAEWVLQMVAGFRFWQLVSR